MNRQGTCSTADTYPICVEDILGATDASRKAVDPFAPVELVADEPPPEPESFLPAPSVKGRRRLRTAGLVGGAVVGTALVAVLIAGAAYRRPQPAVPAKAVGTAPAKTPKAARRARKFVPRQSHAAAPSAKPALPAVVEHRVEQKVAPAPRLTAAAKKRVKGKLQDAQRAMKRRDWRGAQRRIAVVLKVDPRNQQARVIKRRAEGKIRQADKRLKIARAAAKRKDWRRAKREALAVLKIDPRNRQAKVIKQRAATKLRAGRSQRTAKA